MQGLNSGRYHGSLLSYKLGRSADSPTELRTTQFSTTELRITELRVIELRKTQLRKGLGLEYDSTSNLNFEAQLLNYNHKIDVSKAPREHYLFPLSTPPSRPTQVDIRRNKVPQSQFITRVDSSVADADLYHFSGSGSISCSSELNKINWKGKLTKNTFWLGPVGPTDKENQVNLYKKYRFRYITSLKRQGSGSVSN